MAAFLVCFFFKRGGQKGILQVKFLTIFNIPFVLLGRFSWNNNLVEQIFKHFSLETAARLVGEIWTVSGKIDPFAKKCDGESSGKMLMGL